MYLLRPTHAEGHSQPLPIHGLLRTDNIVLDTKLEKLSKAASVPTGDLRCATPQPPCLGRSLTCHVCWGTQNNVAAAENAEAEELLTSAPPWCYNSAGVVTDCSPVADRVIRSGVFELQVCMHINHTMHTHHTPHVLLF